MTTQITSPANRENPLLDSNWNVQSKCLNRTKECLFNLGTGALVGYASFWMVRGISYLIEKLGGEKINGPIVALPYVLTGLISAGIVETARLTHEVGLYALGNRNEHINLKAENRTCLNRLRQKSWKVIERVENVQNGIDAIYSRVFHVRTAKEIRENKTPEIEFANMEILRHAFWDQVHEMISSTVPHGLALKAVVSLGHVVPGGEFLELSGILFFGGIGLVNKILIIKNKQIENEIKKAKANGDN